MGEETGTGTSGGIINKLDHLTELLEEGKKTKDKGIRLPKLSGGKLRKNYVLALVLRTNKEAEIRKLRIEDNMVKLKDNKTYHLALADFVMNLKTRKLGKRYPFIILPEWDLQPLSIDELQGKSISEKRLALPQKIIIEAMKQAQLQKKKGGMKGIMIIIGIIAVAALVYFIINAMSKKKA